MRPPAKHLSRAPNSTRNSLKLHQTPPNSSYRHLWTPQKVFSSLKQLFLLRGRPCIGPVLRISVDCPTASPWLKRVRGASRWSHQRQLAFISVPSSLRSFRNGRISGFRLPIYLLPSCSSRSSCLRFGFRASTPLPETRPARRPAVWRCQPPLPSLSWLCSEAGVKFGFHARV